MLLGAWQVLQPKRRMLDLTRLVAGHDANSAAAGAEVHQQTPARRADAALERTWSPAETKGMFHGANCAAGRLDHVACLSEIACQLQQICFSKRSPSVT